MKRLHVMVKVKDLEGSLRFYRELFDAAPTVVKDDYAKWMLDDPRVNFSIGAVRNGDAAGIEHLGIQAETPDGLAELRARLGRLEAAGAAVKDEGDATCCYAESDKAWVSDAQGVVWEAFYTHGASDSYAGAEAGGRAAECCGPDCCEPEGDAEAR